MRREKLMLMVLVTALIGFRPTLSQAENQDKKILTPDTAIAHLVSLPHGLEFLSDDDTELLETVKANPVSYLPAIEQLLALEESVELTSDETRRRLARAVDLCRVIGAKHSKEVVRRFFDLINAHVAKLRTSDLTRNAETGALVFGKCAINAVMLRNHALDTLAGFADAYAVDTCVRSIEEERKLMTEVVILRYLEKVAALRPDIRPKLEEMYNSADSPLRNNPQLLRVLEAINKAEAERRLERPRDGENERERNDDE